VAGYTVPVFPMIPPEPRRPGPASALAAFVPLLRLLRKGGRLMLLPLSPPNADLSEADWSQGGKPAYPSAAFWMPYESSATPHTQNVISRPVAYAGLERRGKWRRNPAHSAYPSATAVVRRREHFAAQIVQEPPA